jgi:heptosyltransferase-3
LFMERDQQNILVVHIAGLGQTTLALPALRSLRDHFPGSRITIASSAAAAELLELAHCVDEILPVTRFRGIELVRPGRLLKGMRSLSEIRRNLYDLAIEFKQNQESGIVMGLSSARSHLPERKSSLGGLFEKVARGALKAPPVHLAHQFLIRLEPLGVRPLESEPWLETEKAADARLEKLIEKNKLENGELIIGLHPGAGSGAARWPLARFTALGSRLIYNLGARLVILGGPAEPGLAKKLAASLPPKKAILLQSPKLSDYISIAARMSLFVGNHSGPAHLAAAAGAPVVALSRTLEPTPLDLLNRLSEHLRASHLDLISEDQVYEAACRLLKANRAEILRTR